MKKVLFMAALAAAALSSCSNEELMEQGTQASALDGAVSFSAYTARPTRAANENLSTVQAKGFGVFAYDQGTPSWDTYNTSNTQPNFFFNQKVAYNHTSYNANTVTLAQWLAITDATVQGWYTASVTVISDPSTTFTDEEMATLKAITGTLFETGSWTGTSGANVAPDGATLTLAQYKGLTAALQAKFEGTPTTSTTFTPAEFIELPASQQAYVTGTGGSAWVYSPIKYFNNNANALHSFFAYAPYKKDVKSVFALGKAPQIRYTMGIDDYDLMWGKGSYTAVANTNIDMPKQNVTGGEITFAFQHALSCVSIEAVPFIDEVHSGTTHTSGHDQYGTLSEGTIVTLRSVKFVGTNLPSQGLLNLKDGTWTVEGTDEGAYEMTTATSWNASAGDITPSLKPIVANKMIIPATAAGSTVKVQVVYDVTTTDPSNPKNNSTITNTIESASSYDIAPGTAYKFHLDLGLTSVNFTATVVDWNDPATEVEVDLPNNH